MVVNNHLCQTGSKNCRMNEPHSHSNNLPWWRIEGFGRKKRSEATKRQEKYTVICFYMPIKFTDLFIFRRISFIPSFFNHQQCNQFPLMFVCGSCPVCSSQHFYACNPAPTIFRPAYSFFPKRQAIGMPAYRPLRLRCVKCVPSTVLP